MTTQQQERILAEHCPELFYWDTKYERCLRWKDKHIVQPDAVSDREKLHATHLAEMKFAKTDFWWKYCTQLNAIICRDADEPLNQDLETLWEMIHATYPQRLEAYIRTIGKWKE